MLGSTAPHAGRLADGQCVRRIGFCTNREQDLKCCKATIKATNVYSIAKLRRLPVFRCSKPEGLRLPMVHMLSLRSIRHRSTAAGDATRIMAGGRPFSI